MKWKKLILTNLPFVLMAYPFSKLAEAFRLSPGSDFAEKLFAIHTVRWNWMLPALWYLILCPQKMPARSQK